LLENGSVNTVPKEPDNVTAATDTHATIEELLEAMFFIRSVPTLYKENVLESE
jgi:hypothetical protein